MGLKEFFQTIGMSFNPSAYEKLGERKLTNSINHYISMVAVVFIAMCLLFIPALVMLPKNTQEALNNFETLDINITSEMTGPIKIPGLHPLIIIDTSKEYNNIEEGNVLVTEGAIFYKLLPLMKPKKIVREGDFLENKEQIAAFIMVILVSMLPMLLVAAYLYFLVKYLFFILAGVLIAFIAVRIIRFGITLAELFKVGLFASTIMVVVGLLTKPFVPFVYYIDLLLFVVYFVLGIIKVGSFESVVRPKKHKASHYERK